MWGLLTGIRFYIHTVLVTSYGTEQYVIINDWIRSVVLPHEPRRREPKKTKRQLITTENLLEVEHYKLMERIHVKHTCFCAYSLKIYMKAQKHACFCAYSLKSYMKAQKHACVSMCFL